jgi:hypothetical protein
LAILGGDKRQPIIPRMPRETKPFVWKPGAGVDANALARLQLQFKCPPRAMGEAWFMGETRRMFPELMSDLRLFPVRDLQEPLEEMASGTTCFGPSAEWNEWFHYLLGQLVPRSHEHFVSYLLESLATALFTQYPEEIGDGRYPGFRMDVLETLGRSIMDAECWNSDDIAIGKVLRRSNNNPNKIWMWWSASGDFSASMFLCLKYLPHELVSDWLVSALSISSPHWRAQMMVWLVGSHKLLTGQVNWPSDFGPEEYPDVRWEGYQWLSAKLARNGGTFLSKAASEAALTTVHGYFSADVYSAWHQSIAGVSYLDSELGDIPSMFATLYVNSTGKR